MNQEEVSQSAVMISSIIDTVKWKNLVVFWLISCNFWFFTQELIMCTQFCGWKHNLMLCKCNKSCLLDGGCKIHLKTWTTHCFKALLIHNIHSGGVSCNYDMRYVYNAVISCRLCLAKQYMKSKNHQNLSEQQTSSKPRCF